MKEDKENELRIKDKIDFFLDEKVKVHIRKHDGRFLNGIITEREREGVYVIKEDVLGLMHIFISDIFDIEEFRRPAR